MPWDGVERRKTKRYGVKNSIISYKRGGLFSVLSPPSDKYLVLNISQGGCSFITREELSPGSNLVLFIEQQRIKRILKVGARVIWCKKSETVNAFRVGVEFSSLNSATKALLKSLLDSALVENVEISTKIYLKELEKL